MRALIEEDMEALWAKGRDSRRSSKPPPLFRRLSDKLTRRASVVPKPVKLEGILKRMAKRAGYEVKSVFNRKGDLPIPAEMLAKGLGGAVIASRSSGASVAYKKAKVVGEKVDSPGLWWEAFYVVRDKAPVIVLVVRFGREGTTWDRTAATRKINSVRAWEFRPAE